jgi:hypothetical protein
LETIARTPEPYMGNRVAVFGSVVEVIDETSFVLSSGVLGADLLVVQTGSQALTEVEAGEAVTVFGILDRLDEPLGGPLPAETFREWEGEPVLVGESVRPAP